MEGACNSFASCTLSFDIEHEAAAMTLWTMTVMIGAWSSCQYSTHAHLLDCGWFGVGFGVPGLV